MAYSHMHSAYDVLKASRYTLVFLKSLPFFGL